MAKDTIEAVKKAEEAAVQIHQDAKAKCESIVTKANEKKNKTIAEAEERARTEGEAIIKKAQEEAEELLKKSQVDSADFSAQLKEKAESMKAVTIEKIKERITG